MRSNPQILLLASGRTDRQNILPIGRLYGRPLKPHRQNILPTEYSAGRMALMDGPIDRDMDG